MADGECSAGSEVAVESEEIRRLTEGAIDSALAYYRDEHTPDPDPSDPCPRCGSDQLNPTCPYCQMIDTFNRALTNADPGGHCSVS